MLLAAVHLSPWISVPLGIVLAALAAWQLQRPVAPGTPPSRTRIRRFSMLVRIALIVPVVIGLSFADPDVVPWRYVWTWGAAMLLLATSFIVTAIDMTNTARVQAQAQHDLALAALARTLGPALEAEGKATEGLTPGEG